MAKLVDANVILRHLLRDVEEQSAQARIIIAGGAFTTTEVLAEVVDVAPAQQQWWEALCVVSVVADVGLEILVGGLIVRKGGNDCRPLFC